MTSFEEPQWMTHLLAKSADFGGHTLAKHTWDVLERLSDQYRLRKEVAGDDHRLWSRLYWGCFLHDFGKAAQGFQNVLRKIPDDWQEQRHRHEILSLAFVDWLFPQSHPDRIWVIAIIAFHHKDKDYIFEKYGGKNSYHKLPEAEKQSLLDHLTDLIQHITTETRLDLWRWIDEFAIPWSQQLQIPLENLPTLISQEDASKTNLIRSITTALREFSDWQSQLNTEEALHASLYRGLILTSDHSASGGAGEFPPMPLTPQIAERPFQSAQFQPRFHQEAVRQSPQGSTLLVAPTGSGKTEAAIRWAAHQMEHRPAARLFYTLPYQASMNAMFARLGSKYFDFDGEKLTHIDRNNIITIQHSRALLAFYQNMMEYDESEARDKAKWLKNLARLCFFPIQVFSPYQMLKAAYSLKGFETLLLDYTDGLFIFDEIHAYEPKRLAMIITFMGWLADHFGARFLVMTATLPPTVQTALMDTLHLTEDNLIIASPADFQDSQRHQVYLHTGDVLGNLNLILADVLAGKAVLVCCNQVAIAQTVYNQLAQHLSENDMMLLHSRFNGKDRREREENLKNYVGVGLNEKRKKPFVLVATQVVEVSLDVDFDTIYTEPAPLEALLQRFGRVNRGREEKILQPVHVFESPANPNGVQNPYLPYDETLVIRSLEILATYCGGGRPIDEAQVTQMLEDIYQGEIAQVWWDDYQHSAHEFLTAILGSMKPYQSASPDLQDRFYKLFDGIEILPSECVDDYLDAVETGGYLAASQYLINISWKHFAMLRSRGKLLEPSPYIFAPIVAVPYNSESGLDLSAAFRSEEDTE